MTVRPDFPSNRLLAVGSLVISVLIYGFLLWLIYVFELSNYAGNGLLWLPHFNATCNAISATAVCAGIVFVYRRNVTGHAVAMISALVASGAFLVGYLVHHTVHGDTSFEGTGWIRGLYFFLLITHIILAGVALPLIVSTVSLAALRRFSTHRRVARWTYPIWIYVSVTGVAVWFFLRILPRAGSNTEMLSLLP